MLRYLSAFPYLAMHGVSNSIGQTNKEAHPACITKAYEFNNSVLSCYCSCKSRLSVASATMLRQVRGDLLETRSGALEKERCVGEQFNKHLKD